MSGGRFFYANEESRRSRLAYFDAVDALVDAGIALDETQLCHNHSELDSMVRQRVEEGAEVVFVGGGDGTLGGVSEYFRDSETIFGAVPLGTGNQFAREVGLPEELRAFAATVAQGRLARLDLGLCNGQGFLTVATLGLTTDIARNLESKGVFGKASYVPALATALKKMKPFDVEIVGEGETIHGLMVQVVVCNGRTHAGPFLASPDATITDGMFDVYALPPMGVGLLAGAAVLALGGEHTNTEEVDAMKASRLVVRTEPRLPVVIDGEENWFDEMHFEIAPGALRAIVGPGFRAPQDRLGSVEW